MRLNQKLRLVALLAIGKCAWEYSNAGIGIGIPCVQRAINECSYPWAHPPPIKIVSSVSRSYQACDPGGLLLKAESFPCTL